MWFLSSKIYLIKIVRTCSCDSLDFFELDISAASCRDADAEKQDSHLPGSHLQYYVRQEVIESISTNLLMKQMHFGSGFRRLRLFYLS